MMVTACASRTCDCEMLWHSGISGRCQHLISRSVFRLYERASLPVNGQPHLVPGLCNCAHETPPFPGLHYGLCANCPYRATHLGRSGSMWNVRLPDRVVDSKLVLRHHGDGTIGKIASTWVMARVSWLPIRPGLRKGRCKRHPRSQSQPVQARRSWHASSMRSRK